MRSTVSWAALALLLAAPALARGQGQHTATDKDGMHIAIGVGALSLPSVGCSSPSCAPNAWEDSCQAQSPKPAILPRCEPLFGGRVRHALASVKGSIPLLNESLGGGAVDCSRVGSCNIAIGQCAGIWLSGGSRDILIGPGSGNWVTTESDVLCLEDFCCDMRE